MHGAWEDHIVAIKVYPVTQIPSQDLPYYATTISISSLVTFPVDALPYQRLGVEPPMDRHWPYTQPQHG